MNATQVPEGQVCLRCNARPARITWTTAGALGMVHSAGRSYRCERCAYGEQLMHILKRLKALPGVLWKYSRAVVRNR